MLLIRHLCFTCFEAIPGYHEGGRGMLLFQHSHCVLHAFGGCQGTLKEVEGCYKFNACIMFYMLLGDPPVLSLIHI